MLQPMLSALRRHPGAAIVAVTVVLSVVLAACKSPDAAGDAGARMRLAAVPAPVGLMAEASLPTPDASWAKARAAVGGPAMWLPAGVGALAATLLGLPVTVAAEIDGGVPILGALVDAPERPRPRAVIGVHVKEGGRFLDQLTRGEGARFRAKHDPETSITHLEQSAGEGTAAMGVLGNYLLVAAEPEDLRLVGPYVARTMPGAHVPKEDLAIEVPRSSIEGPLLKAARRAWAKLRGPDEALRPALIPLAPTVERWFEILGDLERARLTLVLDEAAAHLRLVGAPRSGGGVATRALAELAVGDAKPLLELPADTLAGLVLRDSAAARAESIGRQVDAVARVFDGELPAAERERIVAVLRAASDARADWLALGLRHDPAGPSAYARAAVADHAKLEAAITDLVDLRTLRPIQASLDDAGIQLSTGKATSELLGVEPRWIRFERGSAKRAGEAARPGATRTGAGAKSGGRADVGASQAPTSVELQYLVKPDGFFAAVGQDAREALRRVAEAPTGQNLGSAASAKLALSPLGADVSFAIFLEPLRLLAYRAGKPAPEEPAPVVLAAGASPASGEMPAALWARVDVAFAALQELVRAGGAL